MKNNRDILLSLALVLMTEQSAFAGPSQHLKIVTEPQSLVRVEGDCFVVGKDKAAELGGELAKASPDIVNGVAVCHLVVLVPGKDGERPRRVAMDVPQ